MKRVLGLDLGSSSIGWAIIEEHNQEILNENTIPAKDKIIAIGSRIIPLSTDESTQFSKGQTLTKNSDRTKSRTQRKGYDRYQLRRTLLIEKLKQLGMYDNEPLLETFFHRNPIIQNMVLSKSIEFSFQLKNPLY